MSLPGAGLLAVLRGQAQQQGPGGGGMGSSAPAPQPHARAPAAEDSSRFSARSGAVRALEHAVAAGSSAQEAHRKVAQGRGVPLGSEYVFDTHSHEPHEAQLALEVTPITMLSSDYEQRHRRQIAVNEEFICYGLKQGHIRVLCRASADRQLCKGHTVPISDMRFAEGGGNLLATGSPGGRVIVWQLVHDGSEVHGTQVLHADLKDSSTAGGQADVHLAWRDAPGSSPASSRHLAVAVGSHVMLMEVDSGKPPQNRSLKLGTPSSDVLPMPDWPAGEAVTALAASPGGALLAAGGQGGTIAIWQLGQPGNPRAATLQLGAAVGGLQWLPCADGWLLLAGNANNSTLELWHAPAAGGSSPGAFGMLQRVKFEHSAGQQHDFFNHVELVPEAQLVVVADTPKKAIYTLHYSGRGAETRVDYISRFGVAVPVLNFTCCWAPTGSEAAGSDDGAVVQLFCVQTTAVQMYKLDPELCCSEAPVEPAAAPAAQPALAGANGPPVQPRAQDSAASLPQPSSQLATGVEVPSTASESELESTASAPGVALASTHASPPAPAATARAAAAAEVAGGGSAGRGEVAESGAAALPEGAAAAPAEAALHGEASIADRVSVLPSQPFPEPPAEDRAGGGSPPSDLEAMSGIPTPEEPASPPSTPVAGSQITVPVPVPVAIPPELTLTTAPAPSHVPQPHMAPPPAQPAAAAPVAPVAQPRLLTPEDVMQQPHGMLPVLAPPRKSPSPSPSQPQPSRRILQRPHDAPAATATLPTPSAAEPAGGAAAAASAAAAAAAPAADAGAVTEAISEHLGGAHKKFVGHVSLMYRELLKAMRAEISAQARQTEQQVSALVASALEASAAQVAAERAAVLAEERGNIERLLVAVSTTLNQDLPAKLREVVRAEMATVGGSVAAAVAPAVQQAVQASLPKEVSGAVKAQLEKQLEKQLTASLQASLAKPLQEAFRSSFQKQLLPAFEDACQAMFSQINTSLTQGFQEHLQAAKSALEEPGALTSQLQASLASASALAAELKRDHAQLSQQLSRTASLAAGGAGGGSMPDVRAELARGLKAGRYEEVFSTALGLQDLSTVVWLCSQVDPAKVLAQEPPPLSQMVLLSLVQQLAADLSAGAGTGGQLGTKLAWIREASMLVNPADALTASHFRPVMEQVYSSLQGCATRVHGADASACKLAMHVVHSQLVS